MPTKQETFDFVATKLIEQGVPSMQPGSCLYRGPNGTKCAAGHLIPDEFYLESDFEYNTADQGLVRRVLADLGYDVPFVRDLQRAHDQAAAGKAFPGDPWVRVDGTYKDLLLQNLAAVAANHELDARVLTTTRWHNTPTEELPIQDSI